MPGAPKSVGGAGLASRQNGSCPSWAATEMTEENWPGNVGAGTLLAAQTRITPANAASSAISWNSPK